MRVSHNSTYNDFIKNLNRNGVRIQKTLNQLASLKEVSQSSDNPLLVSKIINLNVAQAQNKTYAQEIKDSISWSNSQDAALDSVGESMHRIRTLIQASGTATAGLDEVNANKKEIQQELRSIVDALNTNFDGRYVFAGKNTTEAPYTLEEGPDDEFKIVYNGTAHDLPREIADGVSIGLVTNGEKLLNLGPKQPGQQDDDLNVFIKDLMEALNYREAQKLDPPTPDNPFPIIPDPGNEEEMKGKLSGELMKRIDEFSSNFVNTRTEIGAVSNRLKSAEARNESEKIDLAQSLSERQDVDIAEKYMKYQNQMLAFQTTMAMGTKIMQTTILDFVR